MTSSLVHNHTLGLNRCFWKAASIYLRTHIIGKCFSCLIISKRIYAKQIETPIHLGTEISELMRVLEQFMKRREKQPVEKRKGTTREDFFRSEERWVTGNGMFAGGIEGRRKSVTNWCCTSNIVALKREVVHVLSNPKDLLFIMNPEWAVVCVCVCVFYFVRIFIHTCTCICVHI